MPMNLPRYFPKHISRISNKSCPGYNDNIFEYIKAAGIEIVVANIMEIQVFFPAAPPVPITSVLPIINIIPSFVACENDNVSFLKLNNSLHDDFHNNSPKYWGWAWYLHPKPQQQAYYKADAD
jgi:hypothetical protein